jgi:hypothetical protein
MPEWHSKTTDLQSTLASVIADLEDQVSDNPSFAEVAGLEMSEMVTHAAEAVAGYRQAIGEVNMSDPVTAMQLYSMGFVIGTKYGESRSNASPS